MKIINILLFFVCFTATSAYSQQEEKLFVQGLFQIENQETLTTIENSIRSVSNIEIARLDLITQRFFIIVDAAELTEEVVKNWFGEYNETVRCIQIGVYGQDAVNSYPFINCND